jgi:hypothetical protein
MQNDSVANTATEASLIASRGNIRNNAKRMAVENFVATIGAKLGGLCQQFMSQSIAVKIKNPTNPRELAWLDVDREMIQGEFNYDVRPGAIEQQNEGLRRQQTLKFAELMAANKYTNQRWLAEELAKDFDKDPTQALLSEEDVQAQEASNLPEKPPIQIDKIKPEMLDPMTQAAIVEAALKQNGVGNGGEGQIPGPGPTLSPPPSVGEEVNQAPPPTPMGDMPPPNPIQEISNDQGGYT